jgi:hypothetical protein
VLSLSLASSGSLAQPSVYETEPNDHPAVANSISGEVVVLGAINGVDQDGYLWTVSDNDARKRWTFELRGVPGALTIAQVFRFEYADNGVDVASRDNLMKMGTRDGLTPSIARDLIFEPGEYLIGIAGAGGGKQTEGGGAFRPPSASLSFGDEGNAETDGESGDGTAIESGGYRFIIREGKRLLVTGNPGPRLSREQAYKTRIGSEFAAFEMRDTSWYALPFTDSHASNRWDIDVHVPVGRELDARLFNQAGEELDSARSNNRGQLAFTDISPEPQTYFVQLEALEQSGFIHAISSESVGQRVDGEEAEPNSEWRLANRVDLSGPLTGRIGKTGETDYFLFELDEAKSDQLLTLRIESTNPGQSLEFCLLGDDNKRKQCRREKTPVELPDLVLAPGTLGLSVARATEGLEYRITLEGQGPIEPGMEAEPNDALEFASGIPSNNRVKGRLSTDESDFFRFTVTEQPQLWRFQVIGENLTEIAYYDGAGKQTARVRPSSGQKRIRLENMFLLPGQHYLRVSGRDGATYTVLARALGAPDPDGEREPNDDRSRMQRLTIGQTRTGLLSDATDKDLYRFFLANWDHIQLSVQPPADGVVIPYIYWYNKALAQAVAAGPGEPITISGVFPPGDYHVSLSPKKVSDAEYQLSLERLPRFSCGSDCEPNGNNQLYLAAPIPPNGVLEGRSGEWKDLDLYQLPFMEAETSLVIHSGSPVRGLSLGKHRYDSERLDFDSETGTYQATVPAGGPYQLIIETQGADYRLELEFDGMHRAASAAPLAAELQLHLETNQVSAYLEHGQQVSGQVKITNTANKFLAVNLEAVSSDHRWQVTLGREEINLARNGSTSVPIVVQVPPDAWADRPVRVSIRASNEAQAQIETWSEIGVSRLIPPVQPNMGWQIPDGLRGGFNAAWVPFGGQWTEDNPKISNPVVLNDGLVFAGVRSHCCSVNGGWSEDDKPTITYELPGGEPVPVAGIALNHFGSPNPYANIRKATLLLSEDGSTFHEALNLETLPIETEQYFALAEPLMARYARIRIDETFNIIGGTGGVLSGEWKVILQPGYDLSGGEGFNLADPLLGGHLVYDSPPGFYAPNGVIKENNQGNSVRLKSGETQEYVIGFHHNRAAKIEGIEWVFDDTINDADKFGHVAISVSTGSSIGPWEAAGELDLENSGTPAVITFESPVWARFVKFEATPRKASGPIKVPEIIRIREQATGEDYRSVLSEWGYASRRAFYEDQNGLQPQPELITSGNDSRDRAASFLPGQAVAGQVELGKHEHWYRLQVPQGQNTLNISLSGDPTVRTLLSLEDSGGGSVLLRKNELESSPSMHILTAIVEPGAELFFRISEPPRNVVFTWDTSASINAFLHIIYNSLSAFAGQVVPGQEAVNLLPFGHSSPLLRDWYGEPYVLQTILNDNQHNKSSSSGELALQVSTQLLSPLPGTKAIVVITDGITVHHGPMWKDMAEVQPRIFGIGVGGSEGWNVDVFEDWASVNGGHYTHLVYEGEMEVAFDRAATLMRRPASYMLQVESEYREAPGPGMLTVVGGETTTGGSAVELILDASGSMLQRLEGKRRITIAKEVLTEAVTEHIPAGTPVALRVFGHKEPDACRTDLEIPLSPLNPEAAASTIDSIQAMNLARTPIADSLAAVASDVKNAPGPVAIVLVTDGEETCEGDAAKVIESLENKGIQVNLNIVGFAIDNPELEAQFAAWADQGNGRYFSADNQEGLSNALEVALQVHYSVYNQGGSLVAEALVDGAPVELEEGLYRVVVGDAQSTVFERVEIEGEKQVSLALN